MKTKMSKTVKILLTCLGLWILAQAIAWFYGGKEAAGTIAILSGITLFVVGVVAISYESL